jgi:hypothetical protein
VHRGAADALDRAGRRGARREGENHACGSESGPAPRPGLEDNTESSGNPAKTQTFSSKEGATAPKLTITFG